MTRKAVDVVIVGAGIVGAACAEAFSRAQMSVAIVEKSMAGGGATAAGMGHVVVMDDSEAQFALTRYSQGLWNERASSMPREAEYEACGTIWVASDDEEMAAVQQKHEFYGQRGVATQILDARALAAAEPKLREGLTGGLLVPGDSVIYAPCATQWLMQSALARGATLITGVEAVKFADGGVQLSDGSIVPARLAVNAAGSRSPDLTPGVPVRPRKGHLVITDRYPNFVRHQLVELGYLKSAHGMTAESVAFNVQPRSTGQILVGSSRQFDQEHSAVDEPILQRMMRRALEFMPALANLSILRTWTGFRAATPDSLPLIGPCPGREGLYLATGHEGLGITTSLGTAQLLVDQILRRPTAIPFGPYLPSRFPFEQAHA
jgi:glycine/D-amino acid oxidase-like deaminating enzyme